MYSGVSHDATERDLRNRLHHCLEYSTVPASKWSVAEEVTHSDSELPSGKSRCRVDVELNVRDSPYAFEVKMSKSDCVNWFTQRRDYRAIGRTPVLVTTLSVAFKLAPHYNETLSDSYIILDTRDNEWYWPSMPDKVFKSKFTPEEPFTPTDQCPECGCWTTAKLPVIRCANCDWSRLEK
jgi:hypothetical protein